MAGHRITGARYRIRENVVRRRAGSVSCPMGVFPCETGAHLREGFERRSRASRYEYRLILSSDRLFKAVRGLLVQLLPGEVHAQFEEFSFDAWRDTDAWASDETISRDRVVQAWDSYGSFLVEDGKRGFGALSHSPFVEVFLAEHGAIYIICCAEMKAEVEAAIMDLDLVRVAGLLAIDNFEHQHVDVLDVDPQGEDLMDEIDIKFSLIESLGMKILNRDEGDPPEMPSLFWLQLELDLTFSPDSTGPGAFVTYGVTAESHEEATRLVNEQILEIPGALIARVIEFYRMRENDVEEDIHPHDPLAFAVPGVWYGGELHYWS